MVKMANLSKHRETLLVLSKAKPKAARKILLNADRSLIEALSEISLNILNGVVPLTLSRKKSLRRYKRNLRTMSGHGTLRAKRKSLQKGGFVVSLLAAAAPLIFKGISSLVSHIKRKHAEKKARANKR